MPSNFKRMTVVLAVLALAALPAVAAEYNIDTAHSAISFKVKHLTISNVKGTFDDFGGTFTFDQANPGAAAVNAEIKVGSISTGNPKRDEHLLSADFFDAAQFPTMTFKSTSLAMTSKTEGVLKGTFTMHGVSKDVSLNLVFNGAATDPWGGQRVGFSATGVLNRQDFGLSYGQVMEGGGLMIGNDVEFALEVEGTLKK